MFDTLKGKFLAFAAKELLQLTEDEAKILDGSIGFLVSEFKGGKSPEEALTASLNKFYHAELDEGQKIATAFLHFVSRTVHHLI